MRGTAIANRLRGNLLAALIVAFAAGALAPGAAVAGTLDQQQTDASGGVTSIHENSSLAQSFTAGLSGGLDRVDLYLSKRDTPTGPLSVEIRDVFGGAPGNAVLASFSVPDQGVPADPGFLSIPFAAPVPVAAGTQYAIVAHSATDSVNEYWWWSSPRVANPYAGGAAFFSSQSPPLGGWSARSLDHAFKTYVAAPNAVPIAAPSNDFSFGKLKRKKKKGIAILTVNVPGPGEVGLAGPGIKPIPAGGAQASRFTSGGEVKLKIKPHKKGKKARKLRKRLRNKGKARRAVRVTYTPTGGTANTLKRKVKLVKK